MGSIPTSSSEHFLRFLIMGNAIIGGVVGVAIFFLLCFGYGVY